MAIARGWLSPTTRCFLFERLSGLPADSHPEAIDHYHFRSRTADFVRHLTPELANALDNYAYEFLAAHNIHIKKLFLFELLSAFVAHVEAQIMANSQNVWP
ncbi:hypothetical protein [Nocardia sp. NPDC005998]|uniref:hypothetical protein n=1 Tax=Nocardia sp. NPDC005998 TaxID=3156894 RepID=UPI0033B38BFA